MDKKLKNLLQDLRNYKDRLSIALKIADISIFEVDLQKQLFTYFDNSESIFEKKGSDILSDINAYHEYAWDKYLKAVSTYFSHPEDAQTTEDAFRSVRAGRSMSIEARLKAGNTEYKWCKVDLAPVGADGDVQKMIGIISDIHHMKKHISFLENAVYTDPFTCL